MFSELFIRGGENRYYEKNIYTDFNSIIYVSR